MATVSPSSRLRRGFYVIDRLSDARAVILLTVLGLVLAVPGLLLTADPNSDGLFYEVQAKELQGQTRAQAFRAVFESDRAREAARIEDEPAGEYRILSPAWVDYSSQFYERRWLVPGLAVAVGAATGQSVADALQTVSMLGYALIGTVLFLLLRRRFSVPASALGAVGCLLLPPLYRWSFGTYVDSWGVLLESLGLLALILVADRGLRWLPLWVVSMLALSITRDATMILGIAALWLAVAQRRDREATRRNAWIIASGAAAALPALVLGGAPVRENLAYIEAGFKVPTHSSWSHVLEDYPGHLWYTIGDNLTYPLNFGAAGLFLYVVVALAAALILVVILRRARGDAFWMTAHGAILGCIVLLLVANNPQGYRLELVFVPVIAVGLAQSLTYIGARLGLPARR